MISDQAKKEIDIWVAKYPEGRQSSAVMPVSYTHLTLPTILLV